jgi:hypothetical protein
MSGQAAHGGDVAEVADAVQEEQPDYVSMRSGEYGAFHRMSGLRRHAYIKRQSDERLGGTQSG